MEPAENRAETVSQTPPPRGCYGCNLILNALIALGVGIGIVLLLISLNRRGWFALLSGLFGAMLYSALVFPRLLFGSWPGIQGRQYGARNAGEEIDKRVGKRRIYLSIILTSLFALTAFVGLSFLPEQSSVFAFISAVLSLVILGCLFVLGLCVLVLFLARNGHGRWRRIGHTLTFQFGRDEGE